MVSSYVCPSIHEFSLQQLSNKLTDFHKTLYRYHVTRDHSTFIFSNFLSSITPTRWLYEILKWQ
jgi:hypothetical protein